MPRPAKVAVIPIYNEAPTVVGVLNEVARRVDRVIAVDDGSTDDTPELLREWKKGRRNVSVIRLPRNVGMAGALKRGFQEAERLLKRRVLHPQDILINIDADGQHRSEYIPDIVAFMEKGRWDIVLTRRDFSKYPLYKKWGNRLLSRVARLLSGHRYHDVESGFRFMRARVVSGLLDYFTGWRYSCAQEIALITALAGFRVDNTYVVKIAYYRPGTTIWDGVIVLLMSLYTFVRVKLGWKVR
ncbi:MAG: glycosyltransferase family 2 protein [Candidatus Coatesbacteria bacterium]